jgi:hypothetical protein
VPVHLFPLRTMIGMNAPGGKARPLGHMAPLLGRIPLPVQRLVISGITKDETGAASGGFTVYLFDLSSGVPVLSQTTVSDGAGAFAFDVGRGDYWMVDYKTGSPDKAGASVKPIAGL